MPKKASIWTIILTLIAGLIWLDYKSGVELSLFAFYLIPISLAAWQLGSIEAITTSVLSGISWAIGDLLGGHTYSHHFYAIWNTLLHLTSFIIVAIALYKIRVLLEAERSKTEALEKALAEVTVLEGLLPICCECKKIKKDDGGWQQIEDYIADRSKAAFTHGYCPDCIKKTLAKVRDLKI